MAFASEHRVVHFHSNIICDSVIAINITYLLLQTHLVFTD